MKVLLCALNSKFVHSNLAVWYLKAAISHNKSIVCEILESTINEQEDVIYNMIASRRADMVAFSTYIWNKELVLRLAKRISKETGAKIVLGGPEVSYNSKEIMEQCDCIDYIICGEGEEPLAKLLSGVNVEEIEGITYKKCGHVYEKQPYVSKNDPPNPYTKEYLEKLNGRIAYLETSRGCPFKCAFCLSGRCGGVRFFDLNEAKKNILLLANSGAQTVKLIDRTFNADKKRARGIFSYIIEQYENIPKNVCFHFEIEGELLDDETIELLSHAPKGLFQFEIGLQSFNKKTLSAINRKANLEHLCDNIKRVVGLGNIHTHIDLIIGLPYEDMESFKESFNRAYRLGPHMLQIGFLKLLHGADMREKEGYVCGFSDTPPYEITSNQWLTEKELEWLHIFEDVFEKLYNSQRFGLSCEYLGSVCQAPYEMIAELVDYVTLNGGCKTLDEFTYAVWNCFSQRTDVDKTVLRDKLALDRLATNRMGSLPEFLKVHSPKVKNLLNELEKNPETKRQKNIKRAATTLLSDGRLAYVDYDQRDYVTNRFLVKFTEKH